MKKFLLLPFIFAFAFVFTFTGAELLVSWTDNSTNETGFSLERTATMPIDPASWLVVASLPANAVSYSDRDLPAGVTYSYRLRAFNASGHSPYAGPASATVPPVPTAPGNVTVVQISVTVTVTPPAP